MSFLIYADNTERSGASSVPYELWKACDRYLEHFANKLYLNFVAKHKDTSFVEKAQANKELEICERKLKYWTHHPNYDQDVVTRGCEQEKRNWEKNRNV